MLTERIARHDQPLALSHTQCMIMAGKQQHHR
jgi:hypothetical protein